jgi:hypothetical protein
MWDLGQKGNLSKYMLPDTIKAYGKSSGNDADGNTYTMPDFTQDACTQLSLQQNIPLSYDSHGENVHSSFICKGIYYKIINLSAVYQLHELNQHKRLE